MSHLAYKICENCGIHITPTRKGVWVQSKPSFMTTRFCSISCSKKKENAMWVPGAIEKMTNTLKAIGHKPIKKGGNGRELTEPQKIMLNILGESWVAELPIKTMIPKSLKIYPTCYKVDIGNLEKKIAIELDGSSHSGKRKLLDIKKDNFLKSLGWRVIRLKNQEALHLCSIYKSADILLISLEGY